MKPQGVNRVVLAMKDPDEGTALYSGLLGATFHNASSTGELFGFNVDISWDAGIELCTPIPGRDSLISQLVEQNGEGLFGVVFVVDDADAARDRAGELGMGVLFPIAYSQEEIDQQLQGRFKKYKEYFLNSMETCGFGLLVGEIEPKDAVAEEDKARAKGPRGVNRVVIAVKDLDRGIDFYSKLLGATFFRASFAGEPFGFDVANSWDAGIELCAPLPKKDSPISQFIEQHGAGLMAVIFAIDDAEEALANAERMGVGLMIPIEYSQDQIREHLQDRFRKYKEYVLNSTDSCGFSVILGQIELK
jgi:methylmalonyl-CoA/ethylmalonyl-CoA epimerase